MQMGPTDKIHGCWPIHFFLLPRYIILLHMLAGRGSASSPLLSVGLTI